MTAMRLSRLQKRILHWFDAEYQRTNGGIASSHQELVLILHHDKGNISRSLLPLERGGAIGRTPGGKLRMSSSLQ
jgi:hypothetical protein